MITVGIDIAKHKHACCIADDLTPVHEFEFHNSRQGFDQFYQAIEPLVSSRDIRIGFEATGHYGDNLKHFLMTLDLSFMEINPAFLKHYIQSESNLISKTDKVDARAISRYLNEKAFKPYSPSVYHARHLKQLTSERARLVKHRSQRKMDLRNLLDRSFPEFAGVFRDLCQVTPMYLLTNYTTPESMAMMDAKDYEELRRVSHARFSSMRFNELRNAAKTSIGVPSEYNQSLIVDCIEHILVMSKSIDRIDNIIEKIIQEANPPLLSIPGMGALSCAVLLGYYGDIERFTSPDQLAAYAGLCPYRHQSGEFDVRGRMVKKGSPALRNALIQSAFRVMNYSPAMDAVYRKKRAAGKNHHTALVHVAKKLLRIIYKLETQHVLFDEASLR